MEETQENEKPKYAKHLTIYEAAEVARFLTAKEKLTRFALLNRAWEKMIFRNFSWSKFPNFPTTVIIEDVMKFLYRFEHFGGITIRKFLLPIFLGKSMPRLQSAKNFEVHEKRDLTDLMKIAQDDPSIKKMIARAP